MTYNQVSEKAQLFSDHYLGKNGICAVGICFDINQDLMLKVYVETEKDRELVPDEFLGTPIETQVTGRIRYFRWIK